EVGVACVGEAELARGPLEETDADRLLQLGDAAAHRRLGQPERARGGGEALRLDDPNEHRQVVQIHVQRSSTTSSRFTVMSLALAASLSTMDAIAIWGSTR